MLQKLETDSVLLKKDLAFKDSQVKEYETMLASLRENNRQQQVNVKTYFPFVYYSQPKLATMLTFEYWE